MFLDHASRSSCPIGFIFPRFTTPGITLRNPSLSDRAANEICGGAGGSSLTIEDSVCDPGKLGVDCSHRTVRAKTPRKAMLWRKFLRAPYSCTVRTCTNITHQQCCVHADGLVSRKVDIAEEILPRKIGRHASTHSFLFNSLSCCPFLFRRRSPVSTANNIEECDYDGGE